MEIWYKGVFTENSMYRLFTQPMRCKGLFTQQMSVDIGNAVPHAGLFQMVVYPFLWHYQEYGKHYIKKLLSHAFWLWTDPKSNTRFSNIFGSLRVEWAIISVFGTCECSRLISLGTVPSLITESSKVYATSTVLHNRTVQNVSEQFNGYYSSTSPRPVNCIATV